MMIKPTKEQIDEAKAYILKRVQAEISINHALQKYLKEAAGRIIEVAYRYNVRPANFKFSATPGLIREVNAVIDWLREKLSESTYEYATIPAEDDKSKVMAIITDNNHGMTFSERLSVYLDRFTDELEKFIAAGFVAKISESALLSLFNSQYKTIWTNSLITRHNKTAASFGVGKSNVSYNMFDLLMRNTVADAWMYARMFKAKRDGSKGFYSFRGSSYDCPYCDSKIGYHPMSEFPGVWHPRCKCYFVFI